MKQYQSRCLPCPYACSQKVTLDAHMQRHADNRAYKCNKCAYRE